MSATFLIYDDDADRAKEMAAKVVGRMPGARVQTFTSKADAQAVEIVNGGIPLNRWELSRLLDTMDATQDVRLDSIENCVNETNEMVRTVRRDLDEILPLHRGNDSVPRLAIRVATLEKHDRADYQRWWKVIKWALVTLLGIVAWLLGKFGDRLFDITPTKGPP